MKRGWTARRAATRWRWVGVLLLGCGGGASDGDDEQPAACPPNLSYEATAQPFVASYCRTCHGAQAQDRRGAPVGASFDDLPGLRAHGAMIRSYVQSEVMPPRVDALPQPSARERDDFVAWTVCAGIATKDRR